MPFTILCTVPLFFSNTRMSSGPRNAILVGPLSPVNTVRTLSDGLLRLGPPTNGKALVYAAYATKKYLIGINDDNDKTTIINKPENNSNIRV